MSPRGTATNLYLQSEALTVSPNTISAGASSAFGGALPTGVGAMTTITENGSGLPLLTQPIASLTSLKGRMLILSGHAAKVSGSGWLAVSIDSGSNLGWINIGTGSAGAPGSGSVIQVEQTNVAGVYRYWYAVQTSMVGTLGNVRHYIVNGNGAVTHTLGDAIALGGIQIETVEPGQTTPNPYISTLGVPVDGREEPRQGLVQWSEDFSKAAWTKTTGVVCAGASADVPSPDGVAEVSKIVYDGSGASGSFRVFQTAASALAAGDEFFHQLWMRTASGSVTLRLAGNGLAAATVATIDTTWRLVSLADTYAAGGAAQLLIYSAASNNAAFTVYATKAQVTQGNRIADYIKTTSAQKNARGAPRSRAV